MSWGAPRPETSGPGQCGDPHTGQGALPAAGSRVSPNPWAPVHGRTAGRHSHVWLAWAEKQNVPERQMAQKQFGGTPEQEGHGLALWRQWPRRDYEECPVLCEHVHVLSTEGVQGREAGWGTEDRRWSSVEDRSHLKPRPSRLLLQVIAGPLLFHQPRAEAPCGQTEALTWGWKQDWDLGHTLGAHPCLPVPPGLT